MPCSSCSKTARQGATRGRLHAPSTARIHFDTTNVLFICDGAFSGVEHITVKRLGQGGFAFDQLSENCQVSADGLHRLVKSEVLVATVWSLASLDDCQ
jgi:ATP-dependent Clp protease ATP-binding subunit ClpX